MFDLDKWQEIFEIIAKNKLRTALTAFSVAWGIFFLVIFLGFANGLSNGVHAQFEGDAINSIWVNGGKTSKPYKGMQPGRRISFTNEDFDLVQSAMEGVEHVSSRNNMWDVGSITYKNESSTFGVMSCNGNYRYLEELELLSGRFINDNDVREERKVAVLGNQVVAQLFKGQEPLGENIAIQSIPFLVIGTFKDKGGDWDQRRLYIPISSGQKLFNQVNRIQQIAMNTLSTDVDEAKKKEEHIRKILAERHSVAPDDIAGIRIHNNLEEFAMYRNLFWVIKWIIVWPVGILTLISGIVGVGLIMMISVRERTKEIGIRKTLGATPVSIVNMIMKEAVMITFVAGYSGLIMGVGLLELFRYFTEKMHMDSGYFKNPGVDFTTAMIATAVLIAAGSIAGLIPATKAAAISPIAAIREE